MRNETITINGEEFLVHTQIRHGSGYHYNDGLYIEAVETCPDGHSFDRFLSLDETDLERSFAAVVDWIQGDGSVASDIRIVRILTVEG